MKKGIQKAGHVKFTLKHDDLDWPTNSNAYDFGTYHNRGMSIEISKEPDSTLHLRMSGPLGLDFETITPLLEGCPPVLPVAVSWGRGKVHLYINNDLVSMLEL